MALGLHLKKGALHRMLGIPMSMKIPKEILEAISTTEIGDNVENPTFKGSSPKRVGKPAFKVTKLLKERSALALAMNGWKHPHKQAKKKELV